MFCKVFQCLERYHAIKFIIPKWQPGTISHAESDTLQVPIALPGVFDGLL